MSTQPVGEDPVEHPERPSAEVDPRVLFVDDSDQLDPGRLRDAFGPLGIEVRLRHPEETLEPDLDWAQLVVVDYFLKDWPERDATESVARSPRDGLAAAASMRSMLLPTLLERGPGTLPPRTVAFALMSSNLREATFELPEVVLPHVFSRDNGLEWAFKREDLFSDEGRHEIALLARAASSLPERWPPNESDVESELTKILGLSESGPSGVGSEAPRTEAWIDDSIRDVLNCRPPMHELGERSHGLALLRWLLQRIFPYPCFLLNERELCARLRVESLRGGIATAVSLEEELRPFAYAGVLAGFQGNRWWRSGVEAWLYSATDGESGNPMKVAEAALSRGASRSTEWVRPVLTIDGDLRTQEQFVEVEETVRVRPDDWPVYADDAFALRSGAVEDSRLRQLVDPADRDLLIG